MQHKMIRNIALALTTASAVAAVAQLGIMPPEGWAMTTNNGIVTMHPATSNEIWVNLFDLRAGIDGSAPDLKSWVRSNLPNLVIDQFDTNTALNGSSVATIYGRDTKTGHPYVFSANVSRTGLKIAAFEAPSVDLATQNLAPFTGISGSFFGMPMSQTKTSRSNGANGLASAGSSGGGNLSTGSGSYTSPDGRFSSASSSASASASSQNSQNNSQSNHSSQNNSQSSHDTMQRSDSDKNSQSNSNKSSQSSKDSHRQVVYDSSSSGGFKLVAPDPNPGVLSGTYRYTSDLFMAPIGSTVQTNSPGSLVMFDKDQYAVSGNGTKALAGRFQTEKGILSLTFDGGAIERHHFCPLESKDGVITKFAVGPCVYTRTN